MSRSELQDVEALLARILPDPSAYLDRLLSELVERLGVAPHPAPGVGGTDEADADRRLVDHNLLLAAALGACDCWGADPACPVCEGDGAAGWTEPDRDLFTELVAPAVARVEADARAGPIGTARRHPVDVARRDDPAGPSEQGGAT